MKFDIPVIRHDKPSFSEFAYLFACTKDCIFEDIEFDMQATNWFDADMCAVFGALLYYISENLNTVTLTNIPSQIEDILSRNGFLSHYGRMKVPDHSGTTISYQRCDVEDDRYFADYIENEFIRRTEIPRMSTRLLRKFRESIFEIFSNAVQHSSTEKGIFSCGQFFPRRNRLDFTVADLGVGMHRNVQEFLKTDITPADAINWATEGQNTTRRGEIPGGLGLKLLRDFIDLNGGCIQIVSDAGYWQRKDSQTILSHMTEPYPGTVVTVEINTADAHSYVLSSELNQDDIF